MFAAAAGGVGDLMVQRAADGTGGSNGTSGSGCPDSDVGPPPTPDFGNPSQPLGPEWVWRGSGEVGSSQGNWYNAETGESIHPDLNHPDPVGPHFDWKTSGKDWYRIYPDGTIEPK